MYGMFYPWRLEKGLALVMRTDFGARALMLKMIAKLKADVKELKARLG